MVNSSSAVNQNRSLASQTLIPLARGHRQVRSVGLTDRHLLDVAIPHRLGVFEPGRLEFEFLHAAQLLTRFDEVDRGDGRAGMLGQRGEGLQD